jgi:hypothetical protein
MPDQFYNLYNCDVGNLSLCHFVINEFEPIKYLYEIRIINKLNNNNE